MEVIIAFLTSCVWDNKSIVFFFLLYCENCLSRNCICHVLCAKHCKDSIFELPLRSLNYTRYHFALFPKSFVLSRMYCAGTIDAGFLSVISYFCRRFDQNKSQNLTETPHNRWAFKARLIRPAGLWAVLLKQKAEEGELCSFVEVLLTQVLPDLCGDRLHSERLINLCLPRQIGSQIIFLVMDGRVEERKYERSSRYSVPFSKFLILEACHVHPRLSLG